MGPSPINFHDLKKFGRMRPVLPKDSIILNMPGAAQYSGKMKIPTVTVYES